MQKPSQPIRILIADDHGIIRAGLRVLLNAEADMEVVGEAENSAEALSLAASLQPDIAILDISMPGAGGIEVTRQINARIPSVRVLILTVHEDEVLLREAIKAGAAGYIIKRAIDAELIMAVRSLQRGELYVHPAMTPALLRGILPISSTAAPGSDRTGASTAVAVGVEALTPRETEVLQHIALGYTNRQIAELLRISTRTVEAHRANLVSKLHLEGRAALVRYARDHGLLPD